MVVAKAEILNVITSLHKTRAIERKNKIHGQYNI